MPFVHCLEAETSEIRCYHRAALSYTSSVAAHEQNVFIVILHVLNKNGNGVDYEEHLQSFIYNLQTVIDSIVHLD